MEAPEKIYIDDPTGEFNDSWSIYKNNISIEYTRTDFIVERAIGWIDYNNRNGGCNFDGWEKDFKTYVEGE